MHCNPNASNLACFQQNVHHTQQQEGHLIGSVFNFFFGPAAQAQAEGQLWFLVMWVIRLTSWAALMVMILVVIYANFIHPRLPEPSVLVQAAHPELYE